MTHRSTRHRHRVLAVLVAVAALAVARAAEAQSVTMVRAMGPDNSDDGPAVFLSFGGGYTPYIATFGASNKTASGTQEGNVSTVVNGLDAYTYKELSQKLINVGPQFGVRFPVGHSLLGWISVGASYLQLDNTAPKAADGGVFNHFQQITDIKSLSPNPGFSANLGLDWDGIRFKTMTVVLGANVSVFTSNGLSGYSVNGTVNVPNSGQTYAEAKTTNLNLVIVTIEPHAGLEWRPFGSLLINNFGVFGTATLSGGSVTEQQNVTNSLSTTVNNTTTTTGFTDTKDLTVSLSMTPASYLGAYYGWYFALPHFGTLGIEGQFGARLSASFTYQYAF